MDRRGTWGQDRAQKGQTLLNEIRALADHAKAGGFATTEYMLRM